MSQSDSTQDEQIVSDDLNFRDPRGLVEVFDALEEENVDWSITVESEDLPEEERERLENVVNHTVGHLRGIVGRDEVIQSGVYWSLVTDYAEEYIEARNESWADDLTDLEVMAEIVMPTEMARFYEANPMANFFTLYHSKHKAEGWTEYAGEDYRSLSTILEDEGWRGVLSEMAWCACVQDVTQKVRAEDVDVNLGPLEYRRDK